MDRLHINSASRADGRKSRREKGSAASGAASRGPLKFPPGGVFGLTAAPVLEQVEDALTIARKVERSLDQMQTQLDELQAELDDPFVFPLSRFEDDPHGSRPMAA